MKNFLLVISIISVLFLAGCSKDENVNIPDNTDNQQQNLAENQDLNEDNYTIKENELEKKDIISLAYSDENISIPNVNINSDDAKKVNEELNEKFDGDISERTGYEVSYKYNISENILSLLVENVETDADNYTWYNVYNFDINTGKLLSTSDVLGQAKSSELMEKLPEICSEEFYKYWADTITDKNGEGPRFYHEENQKLVANSIDDVPCYIDEERGEQIIIRIASFAGPSYYEHLVNLSDYIE